MLRLWHAVLSGLIVSPHIWQLALIGAADELRRCTSPWGGGCPVRSFLVTLTRLGLALEDSAALKLGHDTYPAAVFGVKEYVRLGLHASMTWSDRLAGRPNRAWQGLVDAAKKADTQPGYYVTQAAAQGIWSSADFDTEVLCALCHLEPATQTHRLMRCSRWADHRLACHAPQAYNYLRQRHTPEEITYFRCTRVRLSSPGEPQLRAPHFVSCGE
eukprot:2424485-Amphidinium_carterae.1